MSYDVFISYARKDNEPPEPLQPGDPEPGWITAFIEALKEEYRCATGGQELQVYFDKKEIRSMDDWQRHIFRHLRESKILLAFLSPNYFKSPWCRKEWEAWIDHEISKHILSEGIAPIYFVEVPGFPDSPAAHLADWVENFRRRQWQVDLRPFIPQGLEALRSEGLKDRLAELERQIRERAGRVARAAASPNRVTDYNPCFVGRLTELNRLFDMLFAWRVGVVATLHGLGGMGKSELAFTYAHAFAHEYPGGRYLLRAEGRTDLQDLLCDLAPDLNIQFSDEESKNPELKFRRLRAGLDQWTQEKGRVLLVLDNVVQHRLLSKDQLGKLNLSQDRVHLLATTRLLPPPGALSGVAAQTHQTTAWLPVDELPINEAARLLEKHRPFTSPEEAEAAREIAKALEGFTLAVETVAIHLANEPDLTYAGFLGELRGKILPTLDELGSREDIELRLHNHEKLLAHLLKPTLEPLEPPEGLAVQYAALLPADQIPLPWLRSLITQDFPAMGQEREWKRLVRKLMGLRLLQSTRTAEEDERHLLVRMHRLVQEVVRGRLNSDELAERQKSLEDLVGKRDAVLKNTTQWTSARWEMEPLEALALLWADQGHGKAAWLLNQVGQRRHHLAEWTRAEPLMRRALAMDEASFGPEHPEVARGLNNLAQLLKATNRLAEAEPLMRRALSINEKSFGPDHPEVARDLSNLAGLFVATNRWVEAEQLFGWALAIYEASFGLGHPEVARVLNNLAYLLQTTGRYAEAWNSYRRALEIWEKSLGAEHPQVGMALNNLAELLRTTNRLAEAEPLFGRALAINEASFGPNHPEVAKILNNLAELLRATNRWAEAEPLYRRALAIDEASFGPGNPNVARDLNNLALLLEDTNRLAEAEPLYRRALAINEAGLGPNHPELASSLNNLAALLYATNRLTEAEPLYRRSLAIFEASLGTEHLQVAYALNNLAELLKNTNRLAEAEPLYRRGLDIWFNSTRANRNLLPHLKSVVHNYAVFLGAMGLGEREIWNRLRKMGPDFFADEKD